MAKKVKYVAIEDFKDLQDGNKVYAVGDTYPNPANKKISDDRIKQLLGKNNRQGRAVIKEVAESKETE